MKRIDTANYGKKELKSVEKIPDASLYIAEIIVKKEYVKGIIDHNYKEVLPFGTMNRVIGIRVINPDIVIVDYISSGISDLAVRNEWGCRDSKVYGSYLLMRSKETDFSLVYNSDAAIMLVNAERIIGAHFGIKGETDEIRYDLVQPTTTFEYNYKTKEFAEPKIFDKYAFRNGELLEYLFDRYLPYHKSKHLVDVLRRRIELEEVQDDLRIFPERKETLGLIFKPSDIEQQNTNN